MLTVSLDEIYGVALLEPNGTLSKIDFDAAAKKVDPYIERTGRLNGLIIHTKSFPGWDSFAALVSHISFVKRHHKMIYRVAIATDSAIGTFAEAVARHFVRAEIKLFPYQDLKQARNWAAGVTRPQ